MEAQTSHLDIKQCESCKKDHKAVPFRNEGGEHSFICPETKYKVILDGESEPSQAETLNEQRIHSMATNYRSLEERVLAIEAFINTAYDPRMSN